ncbi:hypothetical protein [Clostridium massiliodielmoense]|uniref:hypothetical protein n=1 Tax=Clostridium massiliodielmoense TaxID=1776385 RepID=UPI0004DA6625|nr:hypothetical protein [Clostridium massiliodielmoense]KEH96113.1 hypothetical protein Z962_07455 [Clostridium botulinum C/D str. BKT12695]
MPIMKIQRSGSPIELRKRKINYLRATYSKSAEKAIENAYYLDKFYFLKKWWNKINIEDKAYLLLKTWVTSDFPMVVSDSWISFFKDVGYFTDCGIEKPKHSITLYRGSEPKYKKGMSWASDLKGAIVFATRFDTLNDTLNNIKKIYKITVNPNYILATHREMTIHPFKHSFIEYILDYSKLNEKEIEEYDNVQVKAISEVIIQNQKKIITDKEAYNLIKIIEEGI